MFSEAITIIITLIAAALAAVSQYFMKISITQFKFKLDEIVALVKNRGIILSISIYIASAVFYLFALRNGALDFVYPVFASTFVFVLIMSAIMFKEKITTKRALGVALIVLGIALIALTY